MIYLSTIKLVDHFSFNKKLLQYSFLGFQSESTIKDENEQHRVFSCTQ